MLNKSGSLRQNKLRVSEGCRRDLSLSESDQTIGVAANLQQSEVFIGIY
jgi:hypothetical protein